VSNVTFNNISVNRGGLVYCMRKPEKPLTCRESLSHVHH